MEDQYNLDIIIRFINGELPGAEREGFQQQIDSDPGLASLVGRYRDIAAGVTYAGREGLRAQLRELEKQLEAEGFFLTDEDAIAYLSGEADEATARLIQQRAEADPEFADELAWLRNLQPGVELAGREEIREQLRAVEGQLEGAGFFQEQAQPKPKEARVRPLYRRYWIGVAAAVTLLMAVMLFLFRPSPDPYHQLYTDFFAPAQEALEAQMEELELVGMATTDKERRQSLLAALKQYQQGAYVEAGKALEIHLSQFPADEAAQYYLALSTMQTEHFSRSTELLQPLANRPGSPWQPAAAWHLALAYLRLGELLQARVWLEGIAENDNSPYQADARALLGALQ